MIELIVTIKFTLWKFHIINIKNLIEFMKKKVFGKVVTATILVVWFSGNCAWNASDHISFRFVNFIVIDDLFNSDGVPMSLKYFLWNTVIIYKIILNDIFVLNDNEIYRTVVLHSQFLEINRLGRCFRPKICFI